MATDSADRRTEAAEPNRARTYVTVLIVEIVVVAALWLFSRHFQ